MTNNRGLSLLVMVIASSTLIHAESVEGTVLIKRRLTPRRITASVPLYARGPVISLQRDSTEDPLDLERSRVVVYLEGRGPASQASAGSAEPKLVQVGRRFVPDTVVISAGSKVDFPNEDPIFHNVFSLSKPKSFDLGSYSKGETRTVTFDRPGIIYVNCHLHPNMTASIVITPNPWNARVSPNGHFQIADVPPGKYTIVAWHKAAGFFRQQVDVTAGVTAHIEFLVPLDAEGALLEPSTSAAKRP